MRTEVRVFADLAELSGNAAEQVAQWVKDDVRRQGRCSLALAGGSSPRLLYELLAGDHRQGISWSHLHLFWGDERYVPWTDRQSNYAMARDFLVKHVPIPPENVHGMPTDYGDPEEAAAAYGKTLRACFLDSLPRFDLVLLGVGADGHTASLFPDSPAIGERERWVVPARAPVEPALRLTLTLPVLNQAARVCFMVSGKEKAEAVRCGLRPAADPAQCPASAVRPIRGMLHWWIDRAAASLLEPVEGVSIRHL